MVNSEYRKKFYGNLYTNCFELKNEKGKAERFSFCDRNLTEKLEKMGHDSFRSRSQYIRFLLHKHYMNKQERNDSILLEKFKVDMARNFNITQSKFMANIFREEIAKIEGKRKG